MPTWRLAFLITAGIYVGFQSTAVCQDKEPSRLNSLSVAPLNGVAAKAIVQVAIDNHLPLGLVLDKDICVVQVHLPNTTKMSAAQLASELNRQLATYDFVWTNGILTGRPRALSPNVADLLGYRLREFKTNNTGTHLSMAETLWMFTRGQLYPDQGTGFMSGVPPHEEIVAGFSASYETVEQILDHIARLGSGAVWIIKTRPPDWRKTGTVPFAIFDFAGDADELSRSLCKDDEGAQPKSKP
ncbi:MAG: hypothetical protein ACJ72H_21050 [Candidatus Sulfotelmatobacter sp.]